VQTLLRILQSYLWLENIFFGRLHCKLKNKQYRCSDIRQLVPSKHHFMEQVFAIYSATFILFMLSWRKQKHLFRELLIENWRRICLFNMLKTGHGTMRTCLLERSILLQVVWTFVTIFNMLLLWCQGRVFSSLILQDQGDLCSCCLSTIVVCYMYILTLCNKSGNGTTCFSWERAHFVCVLYSDHMQCISQSRIS